MINKHANLTTETYPNPHLKASYLQRTSSQSQMQSPLSSLTDKVLPESDMMLINTDTLKIHLFDHFSPEHASYVTFRK